MTSSAPAPSYAGKPCVCQARLEFCNQTCVADLMEAPLYIACLRLTGRRALVAGGGAIGHEKVEGLLTCGANVHVVAPEVHPDVAARAERGELEWSQREFEERDLDNVLIVIAATDSTDTNISIYDLAEARSLLVNIVDVPSLCNFILPAIVRTGPLAVAISTAGSSPALAKRMKREASSMFGPEYAQLAELLNDVRQWAKDTLPTYHDRKDFFEAIVNGDPDPIQLLRDGNEDAVRDLIARAQTAVAVSV
jgi:siroheme synthase-like protein